MFTCQIGVESIGVLASRLRSSDYNAEMMSFIGISVVPWKYSSVDELDLWWSSRGGELLSIICTCLLRVSVFRLALHYLDLYAFIVFVCFVLPYRPIRHSARCTQISSDAYRCSAYQCRKDFRILCVAPSTNRVLRELLSYNDQQLSIFVHNSCVNSAGVNDSCLRLCTSISSFAILTSMI